MEKQLFSAKDQETKEWIYGTGVTDFLNIYPNEEEKAWLWSDYRWVEVVPKTIGRFTGVLDKNKVRIFEGDIIRGKYIGGIVKFFPEYGIFGTVDRRFPEDTEPKGRSGSSTRYEPYILKPFYHNRIEVIGNIYDNTDETD